jgi:hypothetical protein
MSPEITEEVEVSQAAAHILYQLDRVQEQLAAIRRTAEQMMAQQEASDAAES